MNEKKWNSLCKDMFPLIEQMIDVLKKHEYEEFFSVSTNTDGYFHVSHFEGTDFYEFNRLSSEKKEKVVLNYVNIKEEIENENSKNSN